MLNMRLVCLFIWSVLFAAFAGSALACDSCACSLARSGSPVGEEGARPWFFDFMIEQQNWDEIPASEAHALHHQGHHVHDKSHEEFYHFALSRHLGQDWTIRAEVPYVVRHSIEIDDHRRLGEREVSEGPGDLKLTGAWRFAHNESGSVGVLGGVKLPSGSTTENNSRGVRFEPELQPGSGSVDFISGAVFELMLAGWTVEGNALYTVRTEGDQDFRFGDQFASYTAIHTPISFGGGDWVVEIGADINLQIEARQRDAGVKMIDSGGTTLLAGPAVSIRSKDGLELIGNILLPAVQDLGGLHQELDFVWNLGAKVVW